MSSDNRPDSGERGETYQETLLKGARDKIEAFVHGEKNDQLLWSARDTLNTAIRILADRPSSTEAGEDWRETEVASEYRRGYEDGFFAGQGSDDDAPLTERQIAESFVTNRPDPSTSSEGVCDCGHLKTQHGYHGCGMSICDCRRDWMPDLPGGVEMATEVYSSAHTMPQTTTPCPTGHPPTPPPTESPSDYLIHRMESLAAMMPGNIEGEPDMVAVYRTIWRETQEVLSRAARRLRAGRGEGERSMGDETLLGEANEVMDAQDVIRVLCQLQARVAESLGQENVNATDCFCGEGDPRVDPTLTYEDGYRNDGIALRYIVEATFAALNEEGGDG